MYNKEEASRFLLELSPNSLTLQADRIIKNIPALSKRDLLKSWVLGGVPERETESTKSSRLV